MKYEFDLPKEKLGRRSIYQEEFGLIVALLNSDKKNVRFEYDDEDIANSAINRIRAKVKSEGYPVTVRRTKEFVIVIKNEVEE